MRARSTAGAYFLTKNAPRSELRLCAQLRGERARQLHGVQVRLAVQPVEDRADARRSRSQALAGRAAVAPARRQHQQVAQHGDEGEPGVASLS